jgi:hypothetical protein
MADFSCPSTKGRAPMGPLQCVGKRPCGFSSLWWSQRSSSPLQRQSGGKALIAGDARSRRRSDYNPYNPISYAQNNTGNRGSGGR